MPFYQRQLIRCNASPPVAEFMSGHFHQLSVRGYDANQFQKLLKVINYAHSDDWIPILSKVDDKWDEMLKE